MGYLSNYRRHGGNQDWDRDEGWKDKNREWRDHDLNWKDLEKDSRSRDMLLRILKKFNGSDRM